MNLLDAIKSGRPYRRAAHVCWNIGPGPVKFELADIIADDWVIQEPTVTITASQFWEACSYALKEAERRRCTFLNMDYDGDPLELLANRLGLGDKP